MSQDRPNILLVIVDDMEHNDPTPNINEIAAGGVKLTNFYANPYCSPTRAAVFTGSYAERAKINYALPGNSTVGMPGTTRTLPKMLRDAGYRTALIGKWHLGRQAAFHPLHHFDEFHGLLSGMLSNSFTHRDQIGEIDWWDGTTKDTASREYATTAFTRKGKEFMANTPGPWFLAATYTAVHVPHDAPDGTINFAKQLRALDQGVAELMAAAPPNTIIWFMSDNGGLSAQSVGGQRGTKGSLYQGGIRVPSWVRWDGHFPPRTVARVGHAFDIMPTLAVLVGTVPGRAVDGVSLAAELRGGTWGPVRKLFFANGNKFAELNQPWKLVLINGQPQLFNIDIDPRETRNIASSNVSRVASMRSAITAWRNNVGR